MDVPAMWGDLDLTKSAHAPPRLDLVVPGDTAEGRWGGTTTAWGRTHGLLRTRDGARAVPLTSVLAQRVSRLPEGTRVRVRFVGLSTTRDGHPYRQLAIEELIDEDGSDASPRLAVGQLELPLLGWTS